MPGDEKNKNQYNKTMQISNNNIIINKIIYFVYVN